ncbi:hypothetical protein GCM10022226_63930 [Sphaerisporangium flaviroseum]|uniref:Histidine kinase/HSP90-like ATPase domain-containing protein n=1 Tax=Sphaerisporangium flaviroseum TaxID=509199 RepID=A0ABP7J3Q0_9ACTN
MADRTTESQAAYDGVANPEMDAELVMRAEPVTGAESEMVWRRTFPGLREQASRARALVRCLLADTHWVDDAEFVAAELVNNALLHTRSGDPGGYLVLELVRRPSDIRVGVYDLGGDRSPDLAVAIKDIQPDTPRTSPASGRDDHDLDGDLTESGRGLLTVRRLACRVGCQGDPAAGHLVWALFTAAGRPSS